MNSKRTQLSQLLNLLTTINFENKTTITIGCSKKYIEQYAKEVEDYLLSHGIIIQRQEYKNEVTFIFKNKQITLKENV